MSDAEYITEWPPPSFKEEGIPASKRPKLELSDHEPDGSGESSHRFIQSSFSNKADVLLARWWKEKAKCKEGSLLKADIKSTNPNTILFHISRLNQAKAFLQQRIDYLSHLRTQSESHEVNLSLATCYHMLGTDLQFTEPAIRCAEKAKEKVVHVEDSKEVEWLLELLRRQRTVEEKKERGMDIVRQLDQGQLKMPQYTQVERRTYSDLSCDEFYEHYAKTHTPVIITGIVDKMTSRPWTLQYIKEVIGRKKAPLKKVVSGSVEWAQLEDADTCEVGQFIDSLECQSEDLTYLFDWSLPLNCPELMVDLKIPDYFADNYLLRTPKDSLYHDSWPSLFIAPEAITSELHVDAFSSNFWMALFEGKKRWVFFPRKDFPFLYPIYHNSMDAIFQVDLSKGSESLRQHPLLALTHPRECVLSAGELLFVPCGCPHRVENLENSLAISANFVNGSNFDAVTRELRVNGLVDPRAEGLLSALERVAKCK